MFLKNDIAGAKASAIFLRIWPRLFALFDIHSVINPIVVLLFFIKLSPENTCSHAFHGSQSILGRGVEQAGSGVRSIKELSGGHSRAGFPGKP